jgi:putative ABC transport system permease protein
MSRGSEAWKPSGFGVLALLLSAIGVYGVTALTVNRQTRNIGIRIALGATGRDIIRVVTRRGFTIVTTGLVLGLAGSYGLTQIAGALLFGVTAGDTVTFAVMTVLLIAICLVAIYIPARAATRLDPVAAIRHE